MKAAIYREFGSPEVLSYEDVGDPSVGKGEIVVEVHAVTVNRVLENPYECLGCLEDDGSDKYQLKAQAA